MKVLIACEESQRVCIAFRNKGHEAYSCDIQPCSGGHPEWHMQCDVLEAALSQYWDFIGLHIPCTAMAVSGNRWYGKGTPRHNERLEATRWSLEVWNITKKQTKYAYLENPVSVLFPYIKERVQYVHPWQFGHGETKKTGLALYNLPDLKPTNIVKGRDPRIWKMSPGPERAKLRSKTYQGIANAIADQWGKGKKKCAKVKSKKPIKKK